MANNCLFDMKVVGTKENCYKWLNKMESYDEDNHFWRIFSADIYNEGDENGKHFIQIVGDCAWSIESCCRASGYSNGKDLLEINSRDLDLDVHIFTQELGMGFEEEYLYEHGECLIDECNDVSSTEWDLEKYPTYEQLKAAIGPSCPDKESFYEVDDKLLYAEPELEVHWLI